MERRTLFPGWVLPAFLVAPQLVITILFFLFPAYKAFSESVRAANAFGLNTSFVGLENFAALLDSDRTGPRSGAPCSTAPPSPRWRWPAAWCSRCSPTARSGGADFYRALLIWPVCDRAGDRLGDLRLPAATARSACSPTP